MTAFDWIAIVGAAAWLPQIAGAIYRFALKPRVVVVPVPRIEVGYNENGPMLNLKATLFAERKDAIVVDMYIILRHDRGKTLRLEWSSFVEKFSEVRSSEGESTEVMRDQEATALKLSTILPTDKFIRFQDAEFQQKSRALSSAANSELDRLKSAMPADDAANAFVAGKTYAELGSFHRHNMPWEPGTYEMELRIQLLERKSQAVGRSQFHLSEADVESLQKNIEFVATRIEQIARNIPVNERMTNNNWAFPSLGSKTIMVKS